MKVKQLISILLMLLLLTACSANTDLDLPDEAGSSEQTSNMDASAAEPEDGAEKPTLPEIETPEGAPDAELVETLLVTVVDNINGENTDDGVELVIYAYDEQSQAFRVSWPDNGSSWLAICDPDFERGQRRCDFGCKL